MSYSHNLQVFDVIHSLNLVIPCQFKPLIHVINAIPHDQQLREFLIAEFVHLDFFVAA